MTVQTKLKISSLLGSLVFYAPVAMLIRTRFGISEGEVFLLQAVLSLSIFLLEIPLGYLADRVGHKKIIVWSTIFLILARILLFLAQSFWMFFLEAIIEATSYALTSGTYSSYIYEILGEENYGYQISKIGNYGSAGFILSTLLFAVINTHFGIGGLILSTLVFTILSLIPILYLPKTKIEIKKEETPENFFSIYFLKDFMQQQKSLLKSFHLVDYSFLLTDAVLSMASLVINFAYVLFLVDYGINTSYMTTLILAYTVADFAIPTIIRYLGEERKLGIKATSFLLLSTLACFLIIGPWFWVGIVGLIALPFFLSIAGLYIGIMEQKHIDDRMDGENRATILSYYSMGANFIEILFLLLLSILAKQQFRNIFVVTLICLAVVSLFLLLIRKKMPLHEAREVKEVKEENEDRVA